MTPWPVWLLLGVVSIESLRHPNIQHRNYNYRLLRLEKDALQTTTNAYNKRHGSGNRLDSRLAAPKAPTAPSAIAQSATELTASSSETESTKHLEMGSYTHDNYWKVAYRTGTSNCGDTGNDDGTPILFIHPVGIGLSSWFYSLIMAEIQNSPIATTMYAPNLVGCGTKEGSDKWEPDSKGLSFPLGWTEGCETLIQLIESTRRTGRDTQNKKKWTVVVQGGLAPVGILVAKRNPELIDRLVLTSPPTWKDMITAIPQKELERNYKALRNPILEKLAFGMLESRWAIRFFSNLFLFSQSCPEDFLDETLRIACVDDRPPVQAFNAGLCQHRSFQEELESLPQSTLVVSGMDDKRTRDEYAAKMRKCELVTLPGQNVLPWESPTEFSTMLLNFLQ